MSRRKPKAVTFRFNPARVAAAKRKVDTQMEEVLRDIRRSTKILDDIKPAHSLWREWPQ